MGVGAKRKSWSLAEAGSGWRRSSTTIRAMRPASRRREGEPPLTILLEHGLFLPECFGLESEI